jgi:hypothetical protein
VEQEVSELERADPLVLQANLRHSSVLPHGAEDPVVVELRARLEPMVKAVQELQVPAVPLLELLAPSAAANLAALVLTAAEAVELVLRQP